MKPITARCDVCDGLFALSEVAQAGTGNCPSCGIPLSKDWTILLVEECAAIVQLSQALIRSLRRICGLPGHLEVRPDELLASISVDVPWTKNIETEPGLVAAEIERVIQLLGNEPDVDMPGFGHELRTLASRMMGLATVLDANQEATDPSRTDAGTSARNAARALTEASGTFEDGQTDIKELRRTLTDAAKATDPHALS